MNIKRIIREEIDDLDWMRNNNVPDIKDHLKWSDNAETLGGINVLVREVYNNNPMNFLMSLPKMRGVSSKVRTNAILYKDKDGENLIVHEKGRWWEGSHIFINIKIWKFLAVGFELEYSEASKLIKNWISTVYGIKRTSMIAYMTNYITIWMD